MGDSLSYLDNLLVRTLSEYVKLFLKTRRYVRVMFARTMFTN